MAIMRNKSWKHKLNIPTKKQPSQPHDITGYNDRPQVDELKKEEILIELDAKLTQTTITVLLCGGISKDETQDKRLLIPWYGTDTDSNTKCFSRLESESKCIIQKKQ
eukprot:417855-Ditylum_brightwellii.AAC.1